MPPVKQGQVSSLIGELRSQIMHGKAKKDKKKKKKKNVISHNMTRDYIT